jgi:hypothetical protein
MNWLSEASIKAKTKASHLHGRLASFFMKRQHGQDRKDEPRGQRFFLK